MLRCLHGESSMDVVAQEKKEKVTSRPRCSAHEQNIGGLVADKKERKNKKPHAFSRAWAKHSYASQRSS
jgi:hypothetical protein